MNKISRFLILTSFWYSFQSCGGKQEDSEAQSLMPTVEASSGMKREANAISQAVPSIMVMPSDALLNRMGKLEEITKQGVTFYIRNYQAAFIDNSELKFVIAEIDSEFSKAGFNLENLEQSLKLISNTNAMDNMEGVARDNRAELMNTVRPDYVIEVDYELKKYPNSRNLSTS